MDDRVVIFSEQYYITTQPQEIITVLGSCVAICLYDPVFKIGAMNHYLLPLWNGDGLKSLKYGNINNERMLSEMIKRGAILKNLQAKVFGGAIINFSAASSVGERNAQIAFEFLKAKNIPVLAQDVGGSKGRKILFDITTGDVYVRYSN